MARVSQFKFLKRFSNHDNDHHDQEPQLQHYSAPLSSLVTQIIVLPDQQPSGSGENMLADIRCCGS